MKKLINDPCNVVREMLEGMVDLNPNQAILDSENIIVRANLDANNEVAIICGGGSGHEPAHAGYVGEGFLHAAVCGEVFTSPSTESILAAIRTCAGPKGVLLVVTNYTGDRLNFGLAAEIARSEGILIETVIVADDVALCETIAKERSRGIAGTIFVTKIAGAAAQSGANLAIVKQVAQDAVDNLASMGLALGACTIPAAGKPGFELPDNEIEIGLGLHGEKGALRTTHKCADELIDILLDRILTSLNIKTNEQIALLVNGLGGTPLMELAIVSRRAVNYLREKRIIVERVWSGNFMTSLEMPGISLSIIRLNDARLSYLDAYTNAPGWVGNGKISLTRNIRVAPQPKLSSINYYSTADNKPQAKLKQIGLKIALALESAEPLLTKLDQDAGDGDLGISMCRGAKAIRNLPDNAWLNIVSMLNTIGVALGNAIGGSSGPFYATGLIRAANYLAQQAEITPDKLADAFIIAANSISELGGAKLNDRTMLDAVYPAAISFKTAISQNIPLETALKQAIMAAEDGAKNTAQMFPQIGRASYLGKRAVGIQDAGAVAIVVWLKALQI